MAVEFPSIGNKVVAKVIETKGNCTIGMQPGDWTSKQGHLLG